MENLPKVLDFKNEEFGQVRWVIVNGRVYAVANDIAIALGYSNPRDAISRHCKGVVKFDIPTSSGIQTMNLIPKSDIYRLIVKAADQSQNEKIQAKAERFEKWIFEEVLPQIEMTGQYVAPNKLVRDYMSMSEEDRAIAYFTALKEKKQLEAKYQELKPKAEMYDLLLSADNAQTMGEVAKSFGIGRNKLFELLREKGILIKSGPMKNTPYQRYIDEGYFEVREVSTIRGDTTINVTQTLVTPKGIDFIGKLLKKNNVVLLKIRQREGVYNGQESL